MSKRKVILPHNLIADEWDIDRCRRSTTPFYLKEDLPDPALLPVKLALRKKEHSEVPNKHYFEKFLQYNKLSFKSRRRRSSSIKAARLLSVKRQQYDLLFLDPQLRSKESPTADSPVLRTIQTASVKNPKLHRISRMHEAVRRSSLNYSAIREVRPGSNAFHKPNSKFSKV